MLFAVQAPVQILAGGFTLLDWSVVAAVLVCVTVIGHRLSGKQQGLYDFYLGGGKLPWLAVSLSIIATEISAVTFFAVPSFVARPDGSLKYLQIGLISAVIARAIVAFWLVPAYYERRIYSPYDFIGDRLGRSARRATTVIFMAGGVFAQAARVYITAIIIEVLAHEQLATAEAATGVPALALAVFGMCIVALLWTWIGGVATVVWTDVCLFVLFICGLGLIAWNLQGAIDGGLAAAVAATRASGRLTLFDPSWSMLSAYTLCSVIVGAGIGLVSSYGSDQLIAQRLLACRTGHDARKAILFSNASVLVVALAFAVGVGLIGFYDGHSMSAGAQAMVSDKPDRILPIFVREELPAGLRGLVLAAAFAAAISSLDSILAALGQATASMRGAWEGVRADKLAPEEAASAPDTKGDSSLRGERLILLAWAAVLGGVALFMQVIEAAYSSLLDLALAMSSLAGGPILAALVLAFVAGRQDSGSALERVRPRGATGFLWAAPLGLLTIVFAAWHGPVAYAASWWGVGTVFALWLFLGLPRRRHPYAAIQTIWFAFSLFLVTRVAEVGDFDPIEASGIGRSISWPWYAPLGALITLAYSYLLDRPSSRRVDSR